MVSEQCWESKNYFVESEDLILDISLLCCEGPQLKHSQALASFPEVESQIPSTALLVIYIVLPSSQREDLS